MTSTQRTQVAAATLAGTLLASCLVAAFVDDDALRTILGGVAGASAALLLGAVVLLGLGHRARRRTDDRETLDGLDPLGAARRDGR